MLRRLVPSDLPALRSMLAEPAVRRWWGDEHPGEWLADLDVVPLTIVVHETGRDHIAGLVQYSEVDDPQYRSAGIDLFVAPRYQRRGLGTDALRTLIRWLIDARGHHRLTIDPALANENAIRVYEALGFRRVGVLREYERGADGVWHDGLLMELLARDFIERWRNPQ